MKITLLISMLAISLAGATCIDTTVYDCDAGGNSLAFKIILTQCNAPGPMGGPGKGFSSYRFNSTEEVVLEEGGELSQVSFNSSLNLLETIETSESNLMKFAFNRADVNGQLSIVNIKDRVFVTADSVYTNTLVLTPAFTIKGLREVSCK